MGYETFWKISGWAMKAIFTSHNSSINFEHYYISSINLFDRLLAPCTTVYQYGLGFYDSHKASINRVMKEKN